MQKLSNWQAKFGLLTKKMGVFKKDMLVALR